MVSKNPNEYNTDAANTVFDSYDRGLENEK